MIKNQDCLKFLETLPDDSVDLVLTDPPYFIGYDGGKGWDSQWKTETSYLNWCLAWTKQAKRVLKPERMMVVFGTLKTNTFLRYKLLVDELGLCSQNELVWSYNWGGRATGNFARKHEYAWCWSKGETFLFNGDDVRVERKTKNNPRTGKPYTKGTIPTCVWEKNNHTMSKEYVNWHPTQKPIFILDRIIKAYTNEGDAVLDFFSGSGSTMYAATLANRQFLGCEIDSDYYEKSLKREV